MKKIAPTTMAKWYHKLDISFKKAKYDNLQKVENPHEYAAKQLEFSERLVKLMMDG